MTELLLSIALLLQYWLIRGQSRRVRMLEAALKHLTPDHRFDALEARLNRDESKILETFQAYGSCVQRLDAQDKRLAAALIDLKSEADETYFRKDAAN